MLRNCWNLMSLYTISVYHLKGIRGRIHPKALQHLLDEIRGTREEGIINAVMLRSLQKAKYSPDNTGHFGLARSALLPLYFSHQEIS